MCEQVITLQHLLIARFETDLDLVAVVVEEESATVYGEEFLRLSLILSSEFEYLIQGREVLVEPWPAQKKLADCTMVEYSSAHFKLNVKAPFSIVFMFPGQVEPVLSLTFGL